MRVVSLIPHLKKSSSSWTVSLPSLSTEVTALVSATMIVFVIDPNLSGLARNCELVSANVSFPLASFADCLNETSI